MKSIREKLIELLEDAGRDWDAYLDRCYESEEEPHLTYYDFMVDGLIDNGVTVQKWVSVTERLPEDMQKRVLVTTDCDNPIGNQRIDTDRCRHGEWVRYGNHITHWMPLPEPPKEGEEE